MSETRPWIPPYAMAAAQLAHGLSWLILAVGTWPPAMGLFFPGLAWVHLVALGWLTLTALAVLVHVIPGFLDVAWRGETLARWSLMPFAGGVVGLVAGFWWQEPNWLALAAPAIMLGLMGYGFPAWLTVLSFRPPPGERAPFRGAFTFVLGVLVTVAALGLTMAWGLAGWPAPVWWPRLLPAHALLAGGGWLTLLIFGVSTRTAFRITGRPRRRLPFHGWTSALFSMGIVLMVWPPLSGVGLVLVSLGCLLYVWDLAAVLWRPPTLHRPPVVFVAFTLAYLVGVLILGWGIWLGHSAWQPAFAFLALAGWIGQSVNGYALHIGIRLLATLVRGDEDETEPGELLVPLWSWVSLVLFQLAVVGGTWSLLNDMPRALNLAGWAGLLGWAVWLLNVRQAWRRAVILPGESP